MAWVAKGNKIIFDFVHLCPSTVPCLRGRLVRPTTRQFQDKLKEYDLNAPTVGMFGEISKDGESILEIAAWKRADEYCIFFASKPQVALSRIKQQMHREVGHSNMLPIVRNIRDNMEFLELPASHG